MKAGIFPEKNSRTMPRKLKGDPLFSSGNVCYAEKTEKTLLVQFLGQQEEYKIL